MTKPGPSLNQSPALSRGPLRAGQVSSRNDVVRKEEPVLFEQTDEFKINIEVPGITEESRHCAAHQFRGEGHKDLVEQTLNAQVPEQLGTTFAKHAVDADLSQLGEHFVKVHLVSSRAVDSHSSGVGSAVADGGPISRNEHDRVCAGSLPERLVRREGSTPRDQRKSWHTGSAQLTGSIRPLPGDCGSSVALGAGGASTDEDHVAQSTELMEDLLVGRAAEPTGTPHHRDASIGAHDHVSKGPGTSFGALRCARGPVDQAIEQVHCVDVSDALREQLAHQSTLFLRVHGSRIGSPRAFPQTMCISPQKFTTLSPFVTHLGFPRVRSGGCVGDRTGGEGFCYFGRNRACGPMAGKWEISSKQWGSAPDRLRKPGNFLQRTVASSNSTPTDSPHRQNFKPSRTAQAGRRI